MAEKKTNKVQYYRSFQDDVVVNEKQDYKLPDTYVYIKKSRWYPFFAGILFKIAWIFSFFYCKFGLHISVENKDVLRSYRKKGYFLYGNHTQPIGDVFSPARVCGAKRFYSVASAANLGVPVVGKLLPMLGALPVPMDLSQMKAFYRAVKTRISQGCCVVIYPEAHVWPYYTKIRPFPATSFRFPVEYQVPSFCMTTTYQKRKHGKKPRITMYVDGPFFPDESLSKKEQQNQLRDQIEGCMRERSKRSSYEYIRYEKES